MKNTTKTKLSVSITALLSTIIIWLMRSGFIMWGWNTLAPYIGCPLFTYWEILAMYTGLSFLMTAIWQKKE